MFVRCGLFHFSGIIVCSSACCALGNYGLDNSMPSCNHLRIVSLRLVTCELISKLLRCDLFSGMLMPRGARRSAAVYIEARKKNKAKNPSSKPKTLRRFRTMAAFNASGQTWATDSQAAVGSCSIAHYCLSLGGAYFGKTAAAILAVARCRRVLTMGALLPS